MEEHGFLVSLFCCSKMREQEECSCLVMKWNDDRQLCQSVNQYQYYSNKNTYNNINNKCNNINPMNTDSSTNEEREQKSDCCACDMIETIDVGGNDCSNVEQHTVECL